METTTPPFQPPPASPPLPVASTKKSRLVLILLALIAFITAILFSPLPYYQAQPVICKPGQINCPQPGWHLAPTLYQSLLLSTRNNTSQPNPELSPSPFPDPYREPTGSTPTANWKTYNFPGGLFKYPPSWNENPLQNRGSVFTLEIKDNEGLYSLTFVTQGNFNELTSKPYATLEEFIGPPPNILETLTIDGQPGGRILPRAGSENKNAVVFFSKDKKDIYTLELDTGSSTLADPRVTEESVKTGQELFDLVLSTFRFVE